MLADVVAENGGTNVTKRYKVYVSSTSGYLAKTLYKSSFNNAIGKYNVRMKAYNSKGVHLGNQVRAYINMQ